MAKRKITSRTHPLTPAQQRKFLTTHIPDRIRIIKTCLACSKLRFGKLAAPAIFSRALASFLGFNTKAGRLIEDHDYFSHEPGKSWEVKLADLGGKCLKIDELTQDQKRVLEDGINETNRAFAHLTFWEDPANQDASGFPTSDCLKAQQQRIHAFARVVIDLYQNASKPLIKQLGASS